MQHRPKIVVPNSLPDDIDKAATPADLMSALDLACHTSGLSLTEVLGALECVKHRCLREFFEIGDEKKPAE